MDHGLEHEIWRRAGGACEYCHMPQRFYRVPFQIDHIIARQHGGPTASDNLALSCFHCNTHKGPNIAGVDRDTRQIVRLFNPRTDDWTEHFEWRGAELIGRTAIGRATVMVLAVNDADYVAVREALITEGVFSSHS